VSYLKKAAEGGGGEGGKIYSQSVDCPPWLNSAKRAEFSLYKSAWTILTQSCRVGKPELNSSDDLVLASVWPLVWNIMPRSYKRRS
jgi:hypothetical protein